MVATRKTSSSEPQKRARKPRQPAQPAPEQLWAELDACARDDLGMSAEEFLRRWQAGEFTAADKRASDRDAALVVPETHRNGAGAGTSLAQPAALPDAQTAKPKRRRRIKVPEPLTEEEASKLFDETARFYLSMSGEEFLRKWDANEFGDLDDTPGLVSVYMALPLVRSIPVR